VADPLQLPAGRHDDAWIARFQRNLHRGATDQALDELVDADPATVRAIRRAILRKSNRLVEIVMDALDPPGMLDEEGKPVPGITMAPEKRANLAIKLLGLGLMGADQGDAGLMGKSKRTLRTLQASEEEIRRWVQEGRIKKEGENGSEPPPEA
jgi:hypothetical protein